MYTERRYTMIPHKIVISLYSLAVDLGIENLDIWTAENSNAEIDGVTLTLYKEDYFWEIYVDYEGACSWLKGIRAGETLIDEEDLSEEAIRTRMQRDFPCSV